MRVMLMITCLIIFLTIGKEDYQDEVQETEHYCEMVRAGVWPDFKNIYDEVCDGKVSD